MIPTNNDIANYTIIFISLTIFKAFCSSVHRYKFNQLPQSSFETVQSIHQLRSPPLPLYLKYKCSSTFFPYMPHFYSNEINTHLN